MKAEDQLREYAQKCGCSMRDLRNLVHQTYLDDDALIKRQHETMQHKVNAKQLHALDLEISVNGLDLEIKRRKLTRAMRRIQTWERFKYAITFAWLKSKPKTDEGKN